MKNILRKIASITLFATISVMVLLFVCPMGMGAEGPERTGSRLRDKPLLTSPWKGEGAMVMDQSSCEDAHAMTGEYSISKYSASGNCMSIRLAMVGQTLRNLTSTVGSFYLLVILSVVVLNFLPRRVMLIGTSSSFVRLRYHVRRYRSEVKFLTERKLRQYLILLGNYTVASVR